MLHGQYARAAASPACRSRASDSGIAVVGNAWQWWDNAAGVYARGSVPESGSVLTFRSNGRMRLGHVAVVSRVINPREIEIEHANWWGPGMHGGVARNIPVVDVSEANDWTRGARRPWARPVSSAASIRPTASSTTGPTPA